MAVIPSLARTRPRDASWRRELRATTRAACAGGVWLGALLLLSAVFAPRAFAYPFMISHGYTQCGSCHADPSGGGLLTQYGQAQGALLLATRWDDDKTEEGDERAAELGKFLFGAVDLPEPLLLGGELRGATLAQAADGQPVDARFILMSADVAAGLQLDRFHAQGTLGFASDGAFGATVVGNNDARMVSRTHSLGVDFGEDHQVLLRAGRMNLPFGLRLIEHTAWVRASTRTDINAAQQHGVALSYSGESLRGEAMFIAGNFQLHPDEYRERGYSAYLEYAVTERAAVGVSSLLTHAKRDLTRQTPLWRHAHGLFARYSPVQPLVLSAESDFLIDSQPIRNAYGIASLLQADLEPTQGLHLIATLESQNRDFKQLGFSFGADLGVAWFFAPHADLRLDGGLQSIAVPGTRVLGEAALLQAHFYL